MISDGEHIDFRILIIRREKHRTDDIDIVLGTDFNHFIQIRIKVCCQIAVTVHKVGVLPFDFISIIPLRKVGCRIVMRFNKRLPQIIYHRLVRVGIVRKVKLRRDSFPSH